MSLVINCVLGSTLVVAGRIMKQSSNCVNRSRWIQRSISHPGFSGRLTRVKGQIEDAIAQYQKATPLNPDPAVWPPPPASMLCREKRRGAPDSQ